MTSHRLFSKLSSLCIAISSFSFKQRHPIYEMKPKFGMNLLHNLHLHSTAFHDFILALNSSKVLAFFMLEGVCVHSSGPLYESVSDPYVTVRIFSVLKEES